MLTSLGSHMQIPVAPQVTLGPFPTEAVCHIYKASSPANSLVNDGKTLAVLHA